MKHTRNKIQQRVQVSAYHRSEGHVAAVDPGQSKVGQLHLTLAGYQDILWFQVSVHHAVRVEECKATQQLPHQVLQNTQAYFNRDQIINRLTLNPLSTLVLSELYILVCFLP